MDIQRDIQSAVSLQKQAYFLEKAVEQIEETLITLAEGSFPEARNMFVHELASIKEFVNALSVKSEQIENELKTSAIINQQLKASFVCVTGGKEK